MMAQDFDVIGAIGENREAHLLTTTMQVIISPQSLLENGIRVEKVDDLRLFKFTDDLQDRLEVLVDKNQMGVLDATEQKELDSISELDRIFTYLNSLLVAQK
jgi:hypothetical protein